MNRLKNYDEDSMKMKVTYENKLKGSVIESQNKESEMYSMIGYKDKEIRDLEHKIKASKEHIMDLESNMRN